MYLDNVAAFIHHVFGGRTIGITMGSPKNRRRLHNADYEIGILIRHWNDIVAQYQSASLEWEINAHHFGTDIMHTTDSFRKMIQEAPQLDIVLDTHSCELMGIDVMGFYQEFKPHIRHIHLSKFHAFVDGDSSTADVSSSLWCKHGDLVSSAREQQMTLEVTPVCRDVYHYLSFVYMS